MRFITAVFSCVVGLLGLMIFTTTLYGIYNSYSPVPFWDQWDGALNFYMSVQDGNWHAWLSQHNEHRIFFSRLLFWLDLRFFGGLSIFLLVCNIVMQLAILGAFLFLIRNIVASSVWQSVGVAGALMSMMFFWGQENNFTWGFQSGFIAVYLFALLAMITMEASTRKDSFPLLCVSLLCGTMSAYSMANGLVVFPLLIVLALFLKLPKKRLLLVVTVSVLIWTFYFHNYYQPGGQHTSLSESLLNRPWDVLEFILLYLGSPFYYLTKSESLALYMGLGLLSVCVCFAAYYLYASQESRIRLVLLVFILFIGGSAMATAGGRVNFGLNAAFWSRYMTPALLVWASVFLLFLELTTQRVLITALFWLVVTVFSACLLSGQGKALESFEDIKFARGMALLALNAGVNDKQFLSQVYPNEIVLIDIASRASDRSLSVFADNNLNTAESILGEIELDKIENCQGNHETIIPVGEGNYYMLKGWVYWDAHLTSAEEVLFVNQQNKVVGSGLIGASRLDVEAAIPGASKHTGWLGYVRRGSGAVTAIARYKTDFCKVGGVAFKVPSASIVISKYEVIDKATSLQFDADSGWQQGAVFHDIKGGDRAVGSCINGGEFIGRARADMPSGRESISFIYITGPNSLAQYVSVIGEDNEQLFKFQLPKSQQGWSTLHIDFKGVPVKYLEFADEGSGWGQWSAVMGVITESANE